MREPNSSERGTFQAVVRNKEGVNNAMPGETVTIRASPHLGWTVDSGEGEGKARLLVVSGSGDTATTAEFTTLPGATGPYHWTGRPDDERSWSFTMPNASVSLILQYDFVTKSLPKAAYVAPATRASRSGPYGSGDDNKTGTSWAYATSNLQGVIDAFVESGLSPFDEIWLLEGTYYLDPNKHKDADWAAEVPATERNDERNRAFVLKKGLRIYGGFAGKEGGTDLKAAREDSHDTSAGAVNTVLSGMLRSNDFDHPENDLNIPGDASRYARHVVIAADIASHEVGLSSRLDFDTPTGYDFEPAPDSGGLYGGAGVTLLDTLTISNGIGTTDNGYMTVRTKKIDNNKGAGLYNNDSGLYIRNVRIIDSNSVDGSGMYTTGASNESSAPVLKSVSFTGNRSFLYEDKAGNGAGMAVGRGSPVLLNCQFRNNVSIGGNGAGMYIGGGSVLIKGTLFELNNTSAAGSFYNAGQTWIFANSEFKNNIGGGIYNAGTLKLANVRVANNGMGVSNTGNLSGTNLTVTNSSSGLSNSGKMAISNATISSNSTGVNAGGITVLTNTVLSANGTGLSFALGHGGPDDIAERLQGCVLFNVSILGSTGTGLSASYSSSYSNHRGAANLLLNSVRISGSSGAGLALSHTIASYGTNPPRDKRGLYVTLNNVTISGNTGGGITSNARNIAAASVADRFDELNLRVRNSIILGNGTDKDTAKTERFVVGSFGFGSDAGRVSLSNNSFYLNLDKDALLAAGEAFRVANAAAASNVPATEGALRKPVYFVTAKSGDQITYGATPVYNAGYPADKTEGFALDDIIVKAYFTVDKFELDANDVYEDITSSGENTWYLDPAHSPSLPAVNDVFKLGDGTTATGTSFNTVKTISPNPIDYFPIDAAYLGKGSWADGDGIAAAYPAAAIGDWVYNEFTGTRWDRINSTGVGTTDWDNGVTITPALKYKLVFTASEDETISANKHIMTDTVTPGGTFVNLAGHTEWKNTMIGGVDSDVYSFVTGNPDLIPGIISGVPISASSVLDGDLRLLSTDLINKGDGSFYPTDAAGLTSQCYEVYRSKKDGVVVQNQEAGMKDLIDNYLYTWLNGVYTKVMDITSYKTNAEELSLGNDNGGDKGDQRALLGPILDVSAQPRKNGTIDVGAYEK
jgi:hypothetical protein